MPPLNNHIDDELSESLNAVDELISSLLSQFSDDSSRAALNQMTSGGKRTRAYLALTCARRLELDYDWAISIAAASELLHNASLVHDDIQDCTTIRRGKLATWKKYGTDIAICSGDLMISAAFAAVARINSPHSVLTIGHVHATIAEVISGQSSDLSARGKLDISLEQYIEIVSKKTAPLLSLPIELAFICAGKKQFINIVRRCVMAYALAYQIHDDINDVDIDSSEGSLNIVNVLASKEPVALAERKAMNLAKYALKQSNNLANKIPNGCGDILKSLSRKDAFLKTSRKVKLMELSQINV